MKVSYNWVQDYLDFDLPPIDELLQKIGAQLGAIEEVYNIADQYKGILIVKVIDVQKLEDSDHLNICKIDDGGLVKSINRDPEGYIQVVCGASNVQAGIFVVWLPPGTLVPNSFHKEHFVLETRQIRGIVSQGMLASPKELAIGDSHHGIMVVDDDDVHPGMEFAVRYKLNDYIFSIENKMFTHRPDCFGILGVAREISSILGKPFHSPDIYCQHPIVNASKTEDQTKQELLINVCNELPKLVPRLVLQVLQDVEVKPSSIQMRTYLSRVGIRPINNIVDSTNYFMVLTGQPLHAYDYDKVKAQDSTAEIANITIRFTKDDEKLSLLNEKVLKPRPEAIIISTTDKPIGLGGVMGGNDTEVDQTTTRIILECATFDMYSIRRTSMEHGIFTDAVSRFNKGQSALQNDRIVAWAVENIIETSGARKAFYKDVSFLPEASIERDSVYPPVIVSLDFINSRLGLSLTTSDIKNLLQNAEFSIVIEDNYFTITAPFWRTDIQIPEDIVEEIGRLYGFDNLPCQLPSRDIHSTIKDYSLELKAKIRSSLSRAGANEVLTYSFIDGKLLDKVSQDRHQAFKLANAKSPELQYYRFHALPSLLDKVHLNCKTGYQEFALFELNKSHQVGVNLGSQVNNLPKEENLLDFVYCSQNARDGAPYYIARRYVSALAKDLGVILKYEAISESQNIPLTEVYDLTRSASINTIDDKSVGIVGELKNSVKQSLKLPSYSAAFSLNISKLETSLTQHQMKFQTLPRFPFLEQDICFKISYELPYQHLYDYVFQELKNCAPENTKFSLEPIDIYSRNDNQDYKQVTLRLKIASYERTLTDKEINGLIDSVVGSAAESLQAKRI